MKNILRAELYQLFRAKLFYILFVVSAGLQAMGLIGYIINAKEEELSASAYLAGAGGGIYFYPILFIGVTVGLLCGMDYNDKTANYELMGGYLRKEIYISHMIPATLIGAVGALILSEVPGIVMTIVYGWGDSVPLSGYMLRQILALLPFLRIAGEIVCVTYIIRNGYLTIVFSFLITIFGAILPDIAKSPKSVLLGITNLQLVGDYKGWSTYDILDISSDRIYAYSADMTAASVLLTIAASVLFWGLCLFIGYWFFRQDDVN